MYKYDCFVEVIDENRLPPTDEEIHGFEDFIPTRSYHLTCIRPCVWLIAADLQTSDVTTKKVVPGSNLRKVVLSMYKFFLFMEICPIHLSYVGMIF